jgi:adenylate cyclase
MPQASKTFLVVDDETLMERLFCNKFRREIRRGELNLLFANDGREALQCLQECPQINIIFSDLNMPGMDGLTLLKTLREQYQHSGIISIVITAYGDVERLQQAINEGAFNFLSKPLDFESLQQTLDRALAAQNSIAALQRENAALKQELQRARERIAELEARQLTG